MNLDKVKETGDKAGGAIDSLWNGIFGNGRWWKALIMGLIGLLIYVFFFWNPEEEDIEPAVSTEPYIVETYQEYDDETKKTITVQVWSDGLETIAE